MTAVAGVGVNRQDEAEALRPVFRLWLPLRASNAPRDGL